jgi:signal transduction histidine kinase
MVSGGDATAVVQPGAAPTRRLAAALREAAVALLAAAAALVATALLEGPFHGIYFLPSFAAVVVVALYLGFRAALVTVAAVTAGFAWCFVEPRHAFTVARVSDALRLTGWSVTSLFVAWLASRAQATAEAERRATRRLAALAVSERRARELYQRLQAATAACSAVRTFGEVAFAVVESGLAQLRPSTVTLAAVDERGDLRIVFMRGVPEAERAPFPAIPADAPLPAAECARRRAIVTAVGGDEIDRRYPGLAQLRARVGFRSLASVPVEAAGELQGVLGLGFAEERVLDREERDYLAALADQAGQAIARARSYDAEARARAEAERILRVKEQLLAVVGHDLRNPLSAIVNGTNVMFRRGDLSPADASSLRRIASSADRMSAVIRDLLDFSRVRQGLGIPVEPAPVDLGDVARDVLAEFEERPRVCPVELRAAGDLRLVADRQRLAQMISNLVGNAIQHGEGSPVAVEVAAHPDAVVLRVHNAGRPIDPEVLPHVFEPFRRGRAGGGAVPDSGSIGLGLFIVNAIVKAHAGDVRVETSEGAGTTFTVTLPRSRAADWASAASTS